VRQEKLAAEIKRNAELVIIPDEWKEKFLAKLETWETETSVEKQQKIDSLKAEKKSFSAASGK